MYPERIIGSYYFRPGVSNLEEIEIARENGFRMLKITLPLKGYNSRSYFPIWSKAQELNFPILFHSGVVTTLKSDPHHIIDSWNMHPMRIEPIANAFPELNIIIAHLGVHWNRNAAELARMKPNVYVDLTGEPQGWRLHGDKVGMEHYLWWEGAFKKVVFGTDVHYSKIPQILDEDRERYEKLGLDEDTKNLIFGTNLLSMIGDIK